jgi:hypothetical protein
VRIPRPTRGWRRLAARLAFPVAFLVVTATLAAALQVREVIVSGTKRFPASDIERVLLAAIGSPTVTVRPESLREAVLAVPWVAAASVRVSLDGRIECQIEEREPVAVAVSGTVRELVDASGCAIGPAGPATTLFELHGFGRRASEREDAVAAAGALALAWGAPVITIERLGPRDLAVRFADGACVVVVDPGATALLRAARRVHDAWARQVGTPPQRLDARTPGRIAILPAPRPVNPEVA